MIFAEGFAKLMEDPMDTLYSLAFLFAFVLIVLSYFGPKRKDDDDDDKK